MAIALICIIISIIGLILSLLMLLAVGPQPGVFAIMTFGILFLAIGVTRILKQRKHQNAPDTREAEAAKAEVKSDATGCYCPYCDMEFDVANIEICPNCLGRTRKGRSQSK